MSRSRPKCTYNSIDFFKGFRESVPYAGVSAGISSVPGIILGWPHKLGFFVAGVSVGAAVGGYKEMNEAYKKCLTNSSDSKSTTQSVRRKL